MIEDFLRICKVWSQAFLNIYITDLWGKLRVKNATLSMCILISHLFLVFILLIFIKKDCVIFIFISFFDEVLNFRNRTLTNQTPELETVFNLFQKTYYSEHSLSVLRKHT